MYLVQRHRKWWAFHDIPKDVREAIGKGVRYSANLETEDLETAQIRAAILEARWRGEIQTARAGTPDHLEANARFWRDQLLEAKEEERPAIVSRIKDEAQGMVIAAAMQEGIIDPTSEEFAALPVISQANRFVDMATGQLVPFEEHLEEYLTTLTNEAKTIDMKRSNLKKFASAFPYVQDVKRKEVQKWVNKLLLAKLQPATIRRGLSELRGYWDYLISIEAASEDNLPFEKLTIPKKSVKEAVRDERKAFTPEEVVSLLKDAEARKDPELADLIRLGMWTGARLEELCSLKVDSVSVKGRYFEVEDAKTKAGWRRVPIHPKLLPTMSKLVKDSKDGFVMSGLTNNKYGDRSNAIGKRFGRLKNNAGFGKNQVYHSIRHTVSTMLKSARVEEGIVADLLGHEHDTITFGRYGDRTSWDTLVQVVGLLNYPGI